MIWLLKIAINTSLLQVSTYVGEDGKLHFRDSRGADTVLNFSSGAKLIGTIPSGTLKSSSTAFYPPTSYTFDISDIPNAKVEDFVAVPTSSFSLPSGINSDNLQLATFSISENTLTVNPIFTRYIQYYDRATTWCNQKILYAPIS